MTPAPLARVATQLPGQQRTLHPQAPPEPSDLPRHQQETNNSLSGTTEVIPSASGLGATAPVAGEEG